MARVRHVGRLVKLYVARTHAERRIKRATLTEFRKAWRQLYPAIRRLEKAAQVGGPEGDWWDEWATAFEKSLYESLVAAAAGLGSAEADFWAETIGKEVYWDPATIVNQHEAELGREIRNVTTSTRQSVSDYLREWSGDPDVSLADLVNNLSSLFDERRATLIAVNETTALTSTVTSEVMRQVGVDRWQWWTLRDEHVCPICSELHEKVFTLRDPTPPDASHIGCRCAMVPVL